MNRSKKYTRRVEKPDLVHNNVIINKFIGKFTFNGKKSLVSKIVYCAIDSICAEKNLTADALFEEILKGIRCTIKLRPWKISGKSLSMPYEVENKSEVLTRYNIHLLSRGIKSRKERTLQDKIKAEFLAILNKEGETLRIIREILNTAKANQSYAHYNV